MDAVSPAWMALIPSRRIAPAPRAMVTASARMSPRFDGSPCDSGPMASDIWLLTSNLRLLDMREIVLY